MKVTDPVCGMSIESGKAGAPENYQGLAFYFCSTRCRDAFKTDPARFAGKSSGAGAARSGAGHGSGRHH